ncbi:MAG: hypothetical protein Q7K42_01895, partial [Candidatus Diapherotrites archaeon]|nr:hypothetical protein [Candidatus Diapherotrites archaeon]
SSQPKTRLNLGELQSLFKVSFNPFEQNKIGLEFLDNKTPKFLFAEIKTQNHSDVFIVPINYSVGEKN